MHAKPRRAFTLIELLIVIAILAILFSIGLPAIVKASSLAGQAKCLANIRSMGQATTSYLSDNDLRFPGLNQPDINRLRSSNLAGAEGAWNHPISRTPVEDRPLFRYLNGETSVAECANDSGSSSRPGAVGTTDFEWLGSSYNYPDRTNLLITQTRRGVWSIEGHRLSGVSQPSKKLVLSDNTLWSPTGSEIDNWHEPIDGRPSASIAYVDGHAAVTGAKVDIPNNSNWASFLYTTPTSTRPADVETLATQDPYY